MKRPIRWIKDTESGKKIAVKVSDAHKIRGDFKIISSSGSIFGNMSAFSHKDFDGALNRMLRRVEDRKS